MPVDPFLFNPSDDPPPPVKLEGLTLVRVAVERAIGTGGGDSSLTYASEDAGVSVGDRVRVPLGKGNQGVEGTVVQVGGTELLDGFDPARVKHILARTPVSLPDDLVSLARWISSYYHVPLGTTLQSMTPAAVKRGTGSRTEVVVRPAEDKDASSDVSELTKSAKEAWKALLELEPDPFPATARELADAIGHKSVAAINRLVKADWLTAGERHSVRTRSQSHESLIDSAPDTKRELNPDQSRVVEAIDAGHEAFSSNVLLGVTGSGKTEVYLQLIERTLARGSSAIVLVPEIALTPQTAGRFVARFGGDRVAVLHSGLTASQRHQHWARARAGECPIVVGARSAVFAPVPRLGLVVVDEEHDASYKQEQAPRYHARDLAIVRAKAASCPAVLGSATPSLESWFNATQNRAVLHRLPVRAGGGSMPPVRLVDLAEERRTLAQTRAGHDRLVGPTMEAALRNTLASGGQAIVLLNRRGFATYIACSDRSCGWAMGCERCSVRMVQHKHTSLPQGGFVRCHHCHAEQKLPNHCPVCSSRVVKLGMGTQRAEDELRTLFPEGELDGEALIRVDADSMRSASHYFSVLDRFGRGEARVLVGTQMISKGLDFPNVKLVGVLNADTALSLPDFRAGERTFQLIAQVAGRAGRGTDGARASVIVQTMEPDAFPLTRAAEHDYENFAQQELADRIASGLPPSARMARVVVRHKDAAQAESRASKIALSIRRHAPQGLRVDGPLPCVIERIDERFRFSVEAIAPDAASLRRTIQAAINNGELVPGPDTVLDIDPLSLL